MADTKQRQPTRQPLRKAWRKPHLSETPLSKTALGVGYGEDYKSRS